MAKSPRKRPDQSQPNPSRELRSLIQNQCNEIIRLIAIEARLHERTLRLIRQIATMLEGPHDSSELVVPIQDFQRARDEVVTTGQAILDVRNGLLDNLNKGRNLQVFGSRGHDKLVDLIERTDSAIKERGAREQARSELVVSELAKAQRAASLHLQQQNDKGDTDDEFTKIIKRFSGFVPMTPEDLRRGANPPFPSPPAAPKFEIS